MTEIHLDQEQRDFIDDQVKAGLYKDAHAVVAAGLRLLGSEEGRLTELRRAIDDAERQIARGEGVSFSEDDSLTDYIVKKARERT